jgi:hypothetical protein
MESSSVEKIPVEIWDRILSYATASSLLPFTDNGNIASSLIDTTELFENSCSTLQAYHEEIQIEVRRFRLVCRTWAKLLERTVAEFAYTNFLSCYFPLLHLAGNATYLWVGRVSPCEDWTHRTGETKCMYARFYRHHSVDASKFNQDFLLRVFSPNLKMLLWQPARSQNLDLPMGALGNLFALALFTRYSSRSPNFSLKEISSSAPRLTHLCLRIVSKTESFLFEEVQFPVLSYLYLFIQGQKVYDKPAFVFWSFPRLRTFAIYAHITAGHQAHFEEFLSNHGKSLIELDASECFYEGVPRNSSPIRPSLWKICPNIRILQLTTAMIRLIRRSMESFHGTEDEVVPPLTILKQSFEDLWEFELASQFSIRKQLNIEKVVYNLSWWEMYRKEASRIKEDRPVLLAGPKVHARRLLNILEGLSDSIIDKFGVSLSDFLAHVVERCKDDGIWHTEEGLMAHLSLFES